jgi:hypothetical protein
VSATIEIVRWTAPSGSTGRLLQGHGPARLAIDAVAPGWIWSRLARFEDQSWIEVIAWRSRSAFLRALELSVRQPAAKDWFDLADPGWTLELGEHVDGGEGVPPGVGDLELTSSRGKDADLVAAPDQASHWSCLVELDGRVWSEGEWRMSQPSLLRLGVRQSAPAPASPPWTRVARIEHAFDAAAADLSRSA